MNVSLEWLSDYLDLSGVSGYELADLMSRTGIEVESITNLAEGLSDLVVGQVLSVSDHPESDHLHVTQVDIGTGTPLVIVCGAPNIQVNQKVIVAMVGAQLPGGITIQSTSLRGVVSQGMICSLQEIGFSDNVVPKKYAKGIFVLDDAAPLGMDVVDYLKLNDPILSLDLTPNRADALSTWGVVYEVAAILDREIHPKTEPPVIYHEAVTLLDQVGIHIEDPQTSGLFTLRLIDNVTVRESPLWLQVRLMKMGMRPLNTIVDITNYMMLLYGQPLHAYDFDRLPSGQIGLRMARPGEKLVTLDGQERTLSEDDMIITAGDVPVGLAGVMGGFDTEVTETSRTILLESAHFNPTAVRKTAKRYALRSEASLRNEKGINMATVEEAGQAAAALMARLSGGQVIQGLVRVQNDPIPDRRLTLKYQTIPEKLGFPLSVDEIKAILGRLRFDATFGQDHFEVIIPPRRGDIAIEADILEEIARIYGYSNIPAILPQVSGQPGAFTNTQKFIRRSRQILEGFGLHQVISYILTSDANAGLFKSDTASLVRLALPMSEERTTLRQSLFPALLEVTQFNRARQAKDIAIYETGRVFLGQEAQTLPVEEERLAILLSGVKGSPSWLYPVCEYDFYDLKGMAEAYFEAMGLSDLVTYQADGASELMHPGRTAAILFQGESIGLMGQVHPRLAQDYDLSQATFYLEVNLSRLLDYQRPAMTYQAIPKYPSTSRDIALLVDQEVVHAQLVKAIQSIAGPFLQSVELFDRYQGEKIGEGKQSLAYRLIFQNPEDTLRDQEVNDIMTQIENALKAFAGLEIR